MVLGLVRLKTGEVACQVRMETAIGVEKPFIYRHHAHNWDWAGRKSRFELVVEEN